MGGVGQTHGLWKVTVEDESEPAGSAEEFDLAGNARAERFVGDLTDELVENVRLVGHVIFPLPVSVAQTGPPVYLLSSSLETQPDTSQVDRRMGCLRYAS